MFGGQRHSGSIYRMIKNMYDEAKTLVRTVVRRLGLFPNGDEVASWISS